MKKADAKKLSNMIGGLELQISELENMRDEMQEKIDNASERWLEGDKGQAFQDEMSNIEEIISNLETARDTISNLYTAD